MEIELHDFDVTPVELLLTTCKGVLEMDFIHCVSNWNRENGVFVEIIRESLD